MRLTSVVLAAALTLACATAPAPEPGASISTSDQALGRALEDHASDVQVRGEGVVTRILPDDRDGSQHQRFVVELGTGQTVLIAHNVDLAPRVEGLRVGDRVEFSGEYEWNPQGGVVHWTHRDPERRHEAGWLRHGGRTYQ